MTKEANFVLGVDLDGVVADFYGYMRKVTAEWRGVDVTTLPEEVTYGLPEWDIHGHDQYLKLHRFAVTQRQLFAKMEPIAGAPQALRRLSDEGVRIRIITHRLFISYFHQVAVQQTVQWLDYHDVPYWDLCFMKKKGDVGADLYIEDTPGNIEELRADGKPVIVYTNSTNRHIDDEPVGRANNWPEAEKIIRKHYHKWLDENDLPLLENSGNPSSS